MSVDHAITRDNLLVTDVGLDLQQFHMQIKSKLKKPTPGSLLPRRSFLLDSFLSFL